MSDALQIIFEDLMSRFIVNVPDSEIQSTDRICFQIEQAHWFYEDFHRPNRPTLPHFTLKAFTSEIFQRCPLLQNLLVNMDMDDIFSQFLAYKSVVPVCGCVLLNATLDKVGESVEGGTWLIFKGWTSKSWTFPKGKINLNETEINCAVREMMEETGYDVSQLISEQDSMELTMRSQRNRLFIIPHISEATTFHPQTRKEIRDIKWHLLEHLPGFKHTDGTVNNPIDLDVRYYVVQPFIGHLQRWIRHYKKRLRTLHTPASTSKSLKSLLGVSPTTATTTSLSSPTVTLSTPSIYSSSDESHVAHRSHSIRSEFSPSRSILHPRDQHPAAFDHNLSSASPGYLSPSSDPSQPTHSPPSPPSILSLFKSESDKKVAASVILGSLIRGGGGVASSKNASRDGSVHTQPLSSAETEERIQHQISSWSSTVATPPGKQKIHSLASELVSPSSFSSSYKAALMPSSHSSSASNRIISSPSSSSTTATASSAIIVSPLIITSVATLASIASSSKDSASLLATHSVSVEHVASLSSRDPFSVPNNFNQSSSAASNGFLDILNARPSVPAPITPLPNFLSLLLKGPPNG